MNLPSTLYLSAPGLLLLSACTTLAQPESPPEKAGVYSGSQFSEHIWSTKARTPKEEKHGCKLPPGPNFPKNTGKRLYR